VIMEHRFDGKDRRILSGAVVFLPDEAPREAGPDCYLLTDVQFSRAYHDNTGANADPRGLPLIALREESTLMQTGAPPEAVSRGLGTLLRALAKINDLIDFGVEKSTGD
jgi:hypothetical protein